MQDETIWRCVCCECDKTYKLKDNNNVEIDKQINVLKSEITYGICEPCLEIALHPLIPGLA